MSSDKNNKFGKKKSGNKFSREKTLAYSEIDIIKADNKEQNYKEQRSIERNDRKALAAGLNEKPVYQNE
jgi:hypothetical protein